MQFLEPSYRYRSRIRLSTPHIDAGETRGVEETFSQQWLSNHGEDDVNQFEQALSQRLGGLHVAALNSGTAAIHLGLRLWGIKPGDEVVVPTLTFAGGCNPVLYERARPVFVDSTPESWNIDPDLLARFLRKRAAVNKLPKGVIVVHLYGQSADLPPILEVCGRYGLPILEDAAESLGAACQDKPVGTWGDAGVFSFNANKIVTCIGGGVLVSSRPDWIERARYWSMQACDPDPLRNYHHSELGYNYRLSHLLAGVAREQLEFLDERIQKRREIAFRYRSGFSDLAGISLMPQAPYGFHTNWLSCFLISPDTFGMGQAELIDYLEQANIESRPVWKPMHQQPLYRRYERVGGSVAEYLNTRGICLPSSSNLSLEEQEFVIGTVRQAHFKALPQGSWRNQPSTVLTA